MKKVSIIIVNWNSTDLLKRCLGSIAKYAPSYSETIVVDNNSHEKVDHLIRSFPSLRLIKNNQNLGFGKACNLGAKIARGEYLLFLNPDTQITHGSIEKLVEFLEKHTKAGAVGPRLLKSEHSQSDKSYEGYYLKRPSLIQVLLFYTRLHRYFISSGILRRLFWEKKLSKKIIKVPHIPGAAVMVRKNIFKKIGGFDEDFFLWFEDVNFSRRILKLKYKLFYIPESQIIHEGEGSFRKWPDEKAKREQTLKSLKIYYKKNSNFISYSLFNIIMWIDRFLPWIKKRRLKFR